MAYTIGNKRVARENRAVGSVAGRENMTPGVAYPAPSREAAYLGPSRTVSALSRSGTTATGTSTAHGFAVGNVIKVSGATQAGYNDEWEVATVADANTFTFTVRSAPDSPATGTIIAQKLHQETSGD